jgi:predicted Rossmann-fold nucleotide-binding protein
MAFIDTMIAQKFLPPEHRNGIVVEADPEALIDALTAFEKPNVPKWL